MAVEKTLTENRSSIELPSPSSAGVALIRVDADLKADGFTDSGLKRYRDTVKGFCDDLYRKALALGDRDRAADAPREVTHEHVRSAAQQIAARGDRSTTTGHHICQIGEYLCTAGAGVGGSNLNANWGIGLFGISLALGVILYLIRTRT
jgi:hypothetical protein